MSGRSEPQARHLRLAPSISSAGDGIVVKLTIFTPITGAGFGGCDMVGFSGIIQIVSRLVDLGHRRCVYVTLSHDRDYIRMRAGGFLGSARSCGLNLTEQVVMQDAFSRWELEDPRPILAAI